MNLFKKYKNVNRLTSNVTGIELTSIPATWDTSKAFEFIPTQCIQPFVSGCMLNKPGFVTKPVVAVFPHAVEMGLVLPVIAAAEGTVLIEPKSAFAHFSIPPQLLSEITNCFSFS
jgi:hypothetical protein